VLVHGAWHGAWCWETVARRLDEAGIRAVAVDLPSVSEPAATLADDADRVLAELDEIEEPALLVGHSYGGAVVTDAGVHPRVEHVVFLTAFALDEGESVSDNAVPGGESMTLVDALVFDGDTVSVDPARATEFFYHDCSDAVAAAAIARLRPHALASMMGTPRAVAWREKPSTYVLCADDRAVVLPLQRNLAARTGATIEIATGHSPFLSRPQALAAVLTRLASA
jgi:pimeloyl-ACP methyl ester carboxylesterase